MLVHAEDAGLIDDSRAHGTAYAGFLDSRPPAAEERAIDARHRRRAADRGPRARRAPERGRGDPGAARRPRGRGRRVRGDLPALPDLRRRRDPRRRHRVQVLPADPGRRQPRPRCGTGSPPATSTSWSPTTRRASPSSSAGTWATSALAWGGIASLQLGLPGGVDRRAGARPRPRRRGPLDGDRPRRPGRADRPGPDRGRRRRPTCACSRPTSRSSSTRRGCTTATRSRPTPGVRSPARSGRPGCTAYSSTSTPRRAAGC